MTSTVATEKVLLKSSDGVIFEVDEAVAQQAKIIRHIIEDVGVDTIIPIENVTSEILTKVIEYCKIHVEKDPEADVTEIMKKLAMNEKEEETEARKELRVLDDEFIDVDTDTLYELIMAANFLDIKSLLDLACQKVVNIMKGKKPEEIREIFNIKNDFTEEEEEQIHREQSWTFDS